MTEHNFTDNTAGGVLGGGSFSGQRLDGADFGGQQLEGADFRGADVRGANFDGAILRSASFRDAGVGVRPAVGIALFCVALAIAASAGALIGWSLEDVGSRLTADEVDEVAEGGSLVFMLVVLVGLILWKGFSLAIRLVVVVYLALLVINVVANFFLEEVEWVRAARATLLLALLLAAITAGILGRIVGGVFGSWSIAIVAVLGGLASGRANGGIAGIVVAVSLVIISKRALRGDPRDAILRRVAHRLTHRWGTSFGGADLTRADFTGTDASRTDLRGATLDGVCWDPKQGSLVDAPDVITPGLAMSNDEQSG
ncbi:MAG: pentapeptide repeat-containing protein [Acidimicrobiia bacterium]|nr:pentapeptide repeat-containing protein [Acidimicrobiia bacterium]